MRSLAAKLSFWKKLIDLEVSSQTKLKNLDDEMTVKKPSGIGFTKAIELSYSRGNFSGVSKELNIPTSVLHRWSRESKTYGKNSFS